MFWLRRVLFWWQDSSSWSRTRVSVHDTLTSFKMCAYSLLFWSWRRSLKNNSVTKKVSVRQYRKSLDMFYIDMIIFLYLVSIFFKVNVYCLYALHIWFVKKKETNNVAETLITTHKEEIPRSDIIIFIARMINISQYN